MSSDDSHLKSRGKPYFNRLRPTKSNRKLFHSARNTISRRFHSAATPPAAPASSVPIGTGTGTTATDSPTMAYPSAAGTMPAASTGSSNRNSSAALSRKLADFADSRLAIQEEESAMSFDYACKTKATADERLADTVVQCLRSVDEVCTFGIQPECHGYGTQKHPRFAGDHYLANEPLIAQTQLLKVAKMMPKGAHLHIHFNACLLPTVLLEIAETMNCMFIKSDRPLVMDDHSDNFFLCEITFSIVPKSAQPKGPVDMFSRNYNGEYMHFRDFLRNFGGPKGTRGRDDAMKWLVSKLVFHEDETYSIQQTAAGAWERFNVRTRMMKGLFNYKTAYVMYTEKFLEDLLQDNIQYAEIRPNFMTNNQLFSDDGTRRIDNEGIVNLIIDACEKFKKKHHQQAFDGIKIIYCTPRSFSRENVKKALDECIVFKKKFPDYIAGFDLVGEEGKGKPLKDFVPEFLQFQEDCAREGLDIPFLFHCGETLEIGKPTDQNLYDALLLNSKRIGHGFALASHPAVMEKMKEKNVCVEVCPISNEILGLTPRVGGHTVNSLLANNVHCTVNSDNGTLFKSTLSHDFYQLMVGKGDMGLSGWRQLAEWSLHHSCLSPGDLQAAQGKWNKSWAAFVRRLLQEYSSASERSEGLRVVEALRAAQQKKQEARLERALHAARTALAKREEGALDAALDDIRTQHRDAVAREDFAGALKTAKATVQGLVQQVQQPAQRPYAQAREDVAMQAAQTAVKDALERVARAAQSVARESAGQTTPDLAKLHDDMEKVALWLVREATWETAQDVLGT